METDIRYGNDITVWKRNDSVETIVRYEDDITVWKQHSFDYGIVTFHHGDTVIRGMTFGNLIDIYLGRNLINKCLGRPHKNVPYDDNTRPLQDVNNIQAGIYTHY